MIFACLESRSGRVFPRTDCRFDELTLPNERHSGFSSQRLQCSGCRRSSEMTNGFCLFCLTSTRRFILWRLLSPFRPVANPWPGAFGTPPGMTAFCELYSRTRAISSGRSFPRQSKSGCSRTTHRPVLTRGFNRSRGSCRDGPGKKLGLS